MSKAFTRYMDIDECISDLVKYCPIESFKESFESIFLRGRRSMESIFGYDGVIDSSDLQLSTLIFEEEKQRVAIIFQSRRTGDELLNHSFSINPLWHSMKVYHGLKKKAKTQG